MRPYQDHTRTEIAELLQECTSDRANVMRLIAEHDAQPVPGGRDLDSLKAQLAANNYGGELQDRRGDIARRVQELQLELHIRDTPDLVAEFGPGAD